MSLPAKARIMLERADLSWEEKSAVENRWLEKGVDFGVEMKPWIQWMLNVGFWTVFFGYFSSAFIEFSNQIDNLLYFAVVLIAILLFTAGVLSPFAAIALKAQGKNDDLIGYPFIRQLRQKTLFEKLRSTLSWFCLIGGAALNGHTVTAVVFVVALGLTYFSGGMVKHAVREAVQSFVPESNRHAMEARLINP